MNAVASANNSATTTKEATGQVEQSKGAQAPAVVAVKATTNDTTATKGSETKRATSKAKRPGSTTSQLLDGIKHGQFVHEKAYAITKGQRRPKKGGGRTGRKKADVNSILGELLRKQPYARYCAHIVANGMKPEPPVHLAGKKPEELEDYYTKLRRQASKIDKQVVPKRGRTYTRSQSKAECILGTCIVSWPGAGDENNPSFLAWRELTVRWLKKRYGNNLVGVYAHAKDEPNYHIHCLFDNSGANVKPLMAGAAAVIRAEQQGVKGRAIRDAHDDACRALQNEFYEDVAKHCGLLRKSDNPGTRVSMSEAHLRKAREYEQAARQDREEARQELEQVRAASQLINRTAHENENYVRRRVAEAAKAKEDAEAEKAIAAVGHTRTKAKEDCLREVQKKLLSIVAGSRTKGQLSNQEAAELGERLGLTGQMLDAIRGGKQTDVPEAK